MEELISRIAGAAGIDEDLASKAVGIILNFLNKEGPDDKMQDILGALPGASELIEQAGSSGGGGLLGGLMSSMGGMGGAMAALNELQSSGLDMDQIKGVAGELVGFAKEKAGDEVVDDVISSIPGLNQIL